MWSGWHKEKSYYSELMKYVGINPAAIINKNLLSRWRMTSTRRSLETPRRRLWRFCLNFNIFIQMNWTPSLSKIYKFMGIRWKDRQLLGFVQILRKAKLLVWKISLRQIPDIKSVAMCDQVNLKRTISTGDNIFKKLLFSCIFPLFNFRKSTVE